MLIDIPEEWNESSGAASATGQVQDKLGASYGSNRDKFNTDDPNIQRIVSVLGEEHLSVKRIMELLELKGRDNFLKLYLRPAIDDGYLRPLYPSKPRHPRQKYLLTAKGLALYHELTKA